MPPFVRRSLSIALLIALPGCPVAGSLRGIGTGNDAEPAPDEPAQEEPALYVYACVDADDPESPVLRERADDRETAVDRCVAELRRRRGRVESVSCRCRLEGNAK